MRFSCSSPLLSSMIRMLINVSLAVCSNLSINRLITLATTPFSIIKSLLCSRLFCRRFFDRIPCVIYSKGILVFLNHVVIVILFDEWRGAVQPILHLFGVFQIVVSICLSEIINAARIAGKRVCAYQCVLVPVCFRACYKVFRVFTCQFSHIILPPEIVRPRRYCLALLLLQSLLPVRPQGSHAPLNPTACPLASPCQSRVGNRAMHRTADS